MANEILSEKLKFKLPSCTELPHLTEQLDIKKLKEAYAQLSSKAVSVFEANAGLCEFHPALASKVYGHFSQIPLTRQEQSASVCEAQEDSGSSALSSYRRNRELLSSEKHDEHSFTTPMDYLEGSYFQEVAKLFKGQVTRSRITILEAGKEIPYHIDYDPSYAVRVLIPIHTSDSVVSLFKVRGTEITCNLKAGKAYFLNTGIPHAVLNHGTEARVALMYSIKGIEDLRFAELLD